ncbi:MAG: hypothetical protein ABIF01_02650 [Candidatus Micrarchaeota archaeon]
MRIAVEKELAGKLGIAEGEYEVHKLAEGVVALSFSGELKQTNSPLSPEELAVLKKLTLFKFENRIPFNVNKTLNEQEKKVLEALIKHEFVELYKQGKYARTGVYNIPKDVYPLIVESSQAKSQAQAPARPQTQQAQTKKISGMEMLEKFGYAVVENELEARELSSKLEKRIRAGEYLGVRAFNKKFYIAEKGFYISLSEKIRRILSKKQATVGEICAELKAPEDACAVALRLMNNDSEVIERKRGMYELV